MIQDPKKEKKKKVGNILHLAITTYTCNRHFKLSSRNWVKTSNGMWDQKCFIMVKLQFSHQTTELFNFYLYSPCLFIYIVFQLQKYLIDL